MIAVNSPTYFCTSPGAAGAALGGRVYAGVPTTVTSLIAV